MQKRLHHGFFAEKYLNSSEETIHREDFIRTHFIADLDYFEMKKINLIREFDRVHDEIDRDELS